MSATPGLRERTMSDIHIDAKAYAGTSIESACKKLCEVATRINCNLHCDFNGVTLIVRPGDDPVRLEAAWLAERDSKHGYKVTTADSAPLAASLRDDKGT